MNHENILVCVAWPYANADIHQGNITGSYLPADIYARFHRLKGNKVLMVSGSDSHGTPVTVKAEQMGKSVPEVFDYYHGRFLETFLKLGLQYDLFTHTDTENHHQVSQDMFLALLNNGYLYKKVTPQMYSPTAGKFLPDRYIEGTCPNCGFERARGDQCDNCNTLFESAAQLINPRSKNDDSALVLKDTEHFFLDLPKLAHDGIEAWIQQGKEHWRPHVLNFTRNWILDEGLIGRAITRDIAEWGIPVPVEEYESKTLYVWFEAVIGYLSATIEWAKNNNQPELWKEWWYNPQARTVYFIGKDNIPFHTIFWPAQLLGAKNLYEAPGRQLNLPYDVPANEFMNMEGRKISGSMNWGVWMLEALERHDPDALRYYLTATMPESRDSDWSWQGYVERNNNELVANWGNLANRSLNMVVRYFEGVVPDPGQLTEADNSLLNALDQAFETVGTLYDQCKFRAALQECLRLSTQVNQYLEETSPWTMAKRDLPAAGRSLYVVVQAVSALKVLLAPVLPFTCQKLHEILGEEGQLFGNSVVHEYQEKGRKHTALTYDASPAVGRWTRPHIPVGRQIQKPTPLFRKLEESVVADELGRLGRAS